MSESPGRRTAADLLFIAIVALLATGQSVWDLGFHSDDWALVTDLALAPDQSLAGGLASLQPHDRAIRPLQFGLLALVYRGFGTNPLAYHLAQFGLVLLGAALLFLVLRKLRLDSALALGIALTWAVLPHHSSARLWVAAAQVPLAAAMYFAHQLAELRAAERSGRAAAGWRVLSGAAALASLLSYEIFLPFILLTPVVTWWWSRVPARGEGDRVSTGRAPRPVPFLLAAAPALAAATGALAAKAVLGTRLPSWSAWDRILRGGRTYLAIAAEQWDVYGVRAPVTVARAALDAGALGVAMAILAGAATFLYLRGRFTDTDAGFHESPGGMVLSLPASLIVAGLVAHFVGYSVGFLTGGLGPGAAGVNNRTAMAASLGVALVACGLAVLVARLVGRHAAGVFAFTIAAVVASSGAVNAAVADDWVAAARRQTQVMERLRARVPNLRGIESVLIAGVCRYEGPGIVFESPWGVSGILGLTYRTPDISGDVIAPGTRVDGSGVWTEIYREETLFPFGGLVGYDDRRGAAVLLQDSAAAAAFIRDALEADAESGCTGEPGRGGQ